MLLELELTGFKSFAKKTKIKFSAPIVAVVGPNGSGKSNITEAIRFVLGEQSMKSLRSKSSSDLIFKGREGMPLRRAKVALVFDNRARQFKISENINLDFDQIIIARELFEDGVSHYSVNGSEVRLKDIQEILASVGLGTAHNIIAQGEADRLLSLPPPLLREMISDALNLRIYEYRLRESERKLKKTEENLREAELLRREISPHLKFLKRQVEKIEEGKKIRIELKTLAEKYFGSEINFLIKTKENIEEEKKNLESEIKKINVSAATLEEKNDLSDKIKEENNRLRDLLKSKEELKQKLGRLEGVIEVKEKSLLREDSFISVSAVEFKKFLTDLKNHLDWLLSEKRDWDFLAASLQKIKEETENCLKKFTGKENISVTQIEIKEAKQAVSELNKEIKAIDEEINALRQKISELETDQKKAAAAVLEKEKENFEKMLKRQKIEGRLAVLKIQEETNARQMALLKNNQKDLADMIGEFDLKNEELSREETENYRRQIERLKIKLEDLGGVSPEIIREYEELRKREEYLLGEINDLKQSGKNLRELMITTRAQIEEEFKKGLIQINEKFQEFFEIIFGGGEAKLVEFKEEKKEDEEEKEIKKGVEIKIKLPNKKTRELHILSGGERSLVSIALLLAMAAVNPPPFLVLDETDAALDEANSKKYGDMLERLATKSQLIVVTHNRETMIRANILYGVTMSGGESQLFSVKFEEAVTIAK